MAVFGRKTAQFGCRPRISPCDSHTQTFLIREGATARRGAHNTVRARTPSGGGRRHGSQPPVRRDLMSRKFAVAVASLTVLAACSDTPTTPQPARSGDGASFSASNAPDHVPGEVIVRFRPGAT